MVVQNVPASIDCCRAHGYALPLYYQGPFFEKSNLRQDLVLRSFRKAVFCVGTTEEAGDF